MRLISLAVENISKFSTFSCEFKPGLNVLIGPNGSGKSSLLDAIYYGLYSPIREKNLFISSGSKRGKITVTFYYGDSEYVLEKRFSASATTDATLRKLPEGEIVAHGTNPIRVWVENAIGSEDATKWYIPQGSIDNFAVTIFDKDVLSLARLLGLGRLNSLPEDFAQALNERFPYDQAEHVNVSSMYNSAQTILKERQKELQQIDNQLVDMGVDNTTPDNLTALRICLDKDLERLRLQAKYQGILVELQSLQQKINTEQAQLQSCKDRLNSLDRSLQEANSVCIELLQRYAIPLEFGDSSSLGIANQILAAFSNIPVKHLEDVRWKLQKLNSDFSTQIQTFWELFQNRPAPVSRLLYDLVREQAKLELEIQSCSQILPDVLLNNEGLDKCPTCGQSLENVKVESIRQRLKSLKTELQQVSVRLEEVKKLQSLRTSCRSRLRAVRSSIRTLQKDRKRLEEELDRNTNLYSFVQDLKDKGLLRTLEAGVEEYLKIQSLLEVTLSNLNSLRQQQQRLQASLNSLGLDTGTSCTSVEELTNQIRKLQDIQTRLISLRDRKLQVLSDLELSSQQITVLGRELEKYAALGEFHPWVRKFVSTDFIRSAAHVIRDYVSNVMLSHINHFCSSLDLPFLVRSEVVDEKVVFYADTCHGLVPISRLSYGQRVMLSLITVYILFLVSGGSGVLLVDEPTAGLDSKNVNGAFNLFQIMHDYSLGRGIQCVVSSHEYSLYSSGGQFNVIDLTS